MESARLYQDITHLPGITVRHVCPDGVHTIISSGLSRHGVVCTEVPQTKVTVAPSPPPPPPFFFFLALMTSPSVRGCTVPSSNVRLPLASVRASTSIHISPTAPMMVRRRDCDIRTPPFALAVDVAVNDRAP